MKLSRIIVFALGLALLGGRSLADDASVATEADASDADGQASLLEESADTLAAIDAYWEQYQGSVAPEAADARVLTLAECVDTALAQNPQALVASDEVDEATAQIGQARSVRRPQVKAKSTLVHADPMMGDLVSGTAIASILDLDGLMPQEDIRTDRLTASQVLYAGGQIAAATRASQHLAESQEWRREAALSDIEYQVRQAYHNCLLAKSVIRVADESVETFARHLKDAQQMFDVELISKFEVLRAETELSARQESAVAARNAERLAVANLLRLVALPQDTPVRLTPEPVPTLDTARLDTLIAQALENRPEVRALREAVAAAAQDVRRVQGQYRPKVAASADWTNADGGGAFIPDGWSFSVGAEWELYGGGGRKHERLGAKARLAKLEHQFEDIRQLVELDVTHAQIQIQDAIAQVRTARDTVALANEGLRLAELRFRGGLATTSETLDAELARRKAQTDLVQALHALALGQAALDHAVGKRAAQEPVAAPE